MAMGDSEQVIRYGDVIELGLTGDHQAKFRRVVRESWFVTSSYFIPPALAFTSEFAAMYERLRRAGGMCEVVFGGIMILHTPPTLPCRWEDELRKMPPVEDLDYAGIQELYRNHPNVTQTRSAKAPIREKE